MGKVTLVTHCCKHRATRRIPSYIPPPPPTSEGDTDADRKGGESKRALLKIKSEIILDVGEDSDEDEETLRQVKHSEFVLSLAFVVQEYRCSRVSTTIIISGYSHYSMFDVSSK